MNVTIHYLADHLHHAEELARLHDGEWGHLFPRVSVEKRAGLLQSAAGRSEIPTVVLAVDESTLVGSAALIEQDMSDRPELSPWLAAVYVKPAYRRRGIAAALVARIEQEAETLGIKKMYLFTEHEEAFYAKRGWRLTEHREYHGTPVAVMVKAL